MKEPWPSSQQHLDATLQQLARKNPLVLAAPFPVHNGSLARQKRKWVHHMCSAGAHFGYPPVAQSQGIVLRYPQHETLLPSVAYQFATQIPIPGQKNPLSPDPVDKHPEAFDTMPRICTQVAGVNDAMFLDPSFYLAMQLELHGIEHQRPINFGYVEMAAQEKWFRSIQAWPLSRIEEQRLLSDLAGKIVFVCMRNNSQDTFLTPEGVLPGVIIHASTFYSHLQPTNPVGPWLAFAIDILVGFFIGLLFHQLWHMYNRAELKMASNMQPAIRQYLAVRGLLILNFLVLGLVLALLMYMSGWLLSRGAWLNPGPIILGRFVETLVSSRAGFYPHPGELRITDRYDLLFGVVLLAVLWVLVHPWQQG